MALEKRVFAVLNAFVLITASATVIATHMKGDVTESPCEYRDTNRWTAVFAKFAVAISLIGLGNLVTSWKYKAFSKLYLWLVVAMGLATVVLLGMAFQFIGMGPSEDGYSFSLLERQYTNPTTWKTVEECLVKSDVCKGILPTSQTSVLPALDYNKVMQSHCCRPPSHCWSLQINGTYWVMPVKDPDCVRWRQNSGGPTFDADMCKRGYLHTVFDHWAFTIFFNYIIWSSCFFLCIICEEECVERIPQRSFKRVDRLDLPQP